MFELCSVRKNLDRHLTVDCRDRGIWSHTWLHEKDSSRPERSGQAATGFDRRIESRFDSRRFSGGGPGGGAVALSGPGSKTAGLGTRRDDRRILAGNPFRSSGDARKSPSILSYTYYVGIVRRVFGNSV